MSESNPDKKSKLETSLETLIKLKTGEVESMKSELLNLSGELDQLLSQSQEEVQALRALFQGLVPTKLPRVEGFEFSRKFSYGTEKGGDYFDLFPHAQKSSWSLLISACDRYATSAQIMGHIISLAAHFASGNGSAKDHVSQLFAQLTDVKPTDRFSLFYATINRATLSMEFYCQGEIVGFIVQPSTISLGSSVTQLSASNPKQMELGQLFSGLSNEVTQSEISKQIKTVAVKLSAGTRVCLFSPGVTQVLDSSRLGNLCRDMAAGPIHDLRNEINFQLEKTTGKSQPARDQIVFLFEINKNVLSLA